MMAFDRSWVFLFQLGKGKGETHERGKRVTMRPMWKEKRWEVAFFLSESHRGRGGHDTLEKRAWVSLPLRCKKKGGLLKSHRVVQRKGGGKGGGDAHLYRYGGSGRTSETMKRERRESKHLFILRPGKKRERSSPQK